MEEGLPLNILNLFKVLYSLKNKEIELEYTWQGEDGYYECEWSKGYFEGFIFEHIDDSYINLVFSIVNKDGNTETSNLFFYQDWQIFERIENDKQIYLLAENISSDHYISISILNSIGDNNVNLY